MNICVLLLSMFLWATVLANDYTPTGAVSYQTYTRIFNRPAKQALSKEIPASYPLNFEKRLAYPFKVSVGVPVDHPVAFQLPKPYPLPIVTALPFQLEKPIPYSLTLNQQVLQPLTTNHPLALFMKFPYPPSTTLQHLQQSAHQHLFNQQYYK